jgi:hypothetical protein
MAQILKKMIVEISVHKMDKLEGKLNKLTKALTKAKSLMEELKNTTVEINCNWHK